MPDLSSIVSQIVSMDVPGELLEKDPGAVQVIDDKLPSSPPQANTPVIAEPEPQLNISTNNPQDNQVQKQELSTEIKPKHAGGRPCKFCQNKEEYLRISQGYLDECRRTDKPRVPYINEIAMLLRANRESFHQWRNTEHDHGEFPDIIKELELIQEFRLQQRIMGKFNPTGAIFLLKTKHGYIETEKQILAGDKGSEPLQIEIIEERTHVE